MKSNIPDATVFRLIQPHLEIDTESLPGSTERFVQLLHEYLTNQGEDETGLRLFTLMDHAKSLRETYQRIELLLARLDTQEASSSDE
jgi:hypothetical protein